MPASPGFDASAFPGLVPMTWLKNNTNLVWCGYYLGAANTSHPGTDWLGQRAALVALGYGLAPLYVGEQEPTAPVLGNKNPSAAKGTLDGAQAIALMHGEGFPVGTTVYLDVEDGSLSPLMQGYVGAWIDAFNGQDFSPGVYCSHLIAAAVVALRPATAPRIWAFKLTTQTGGPLGGTNFPTQDPSGCGYPADAWQWAQQCQLNLPGTPVNHLVVDLSTAITPDPGG